MSLVVNLANLAQSMGNEMKALRTLVNGNTTGLSGLTTTNKATLVAAINEVDAQVDAIAAQPGGATINDSATSTSSVWSSSKTQSAIDAKTSIDDSAPSTTKTYSSSKTQSVANAASAAAAAGLINDTAAGTTSVYSSSKTQSVANAAASAAASAASAALINDTTPGTANVYSSSKTNSVVSAAVAQAKSDILGGAGAAYDTLKELYDLLQAGDSADQTAIQNLTTALGNRVRFDAAQSLTTAQQTQALSNIGAQRASDVGDTTTDFVATFQNAYQAQ
jgi:hypothetical protein